MEISEQEYNELKTCERICNGISYTVTLTREQIDKLNILSNPDGDFARLQESCIKKDIAMRKAISEKESILQKFDNLNGQISRFKYSSLLKKMFFKFYT